MEKDFFEDIMKKSEQRLIRERSVQTNNTNVISDKLTQEGMTIFFSITIFILAMLFLRKGLFKKIISVFCIVSLYSSTIGYFGLKYQSHIPGLLINIIIITSLVFYLRKKRRMRRNER